MASPVSQRDIELVKAVYERFGRGAVLQMMEPYNVTKVSHMTNAQRSLFRIDMMQRLGKRTLWERVKAWISESENDAR